jgi:hypothetical protein
MKFITTYLIHLINVAKVSISYNPTFNDVNPWVCLDFTDIFRENLTSFSTQKLLCITDLFRRI